MRVSIKYIIILLFSVLYGCVEPFNPDIPDNQQEFLVVDGLITDKSGPYTVKIFKSSSFNDENEHVSGVEVSIEDKDGLTEYLIENSPGVYQTSNLQGAIGNSYRLNIDYNGQQYQSTWETINASPAIDSIQFQHEVRGTTDKDADLEGLQFFVDTHGPENATRFFRYEWTETWQIGVYWPSTLDYIGNDEAVPTSTPLYRCWKNRNSTGINIGTTAGLAQNVLSEHPLFFAPRDEDRFTRGYSLLVKQYALEENEYTFWKSLKESNQELGSLFDKQPANVLGNISSVTSSGDVVLGYFSATGSQEVRIFINPSDLPLSLIRMPVCIALDTLLKADFVDPQFPPPKDYETTLTDFLKGGKFFYGFTGVASVTGALISEPICSDCTAKGGDLNKPEFWDE